jgi:RHS repeat-associated protein
MTTTKQLHVGQQRKLRGKHRSLRTDAASVQFDDVAVSDVVKYYAAGGTRVAIRKAGAVSYVFGDHLSSTSLTTNASGVRTGELWYKPRGESRGTPYGTPTTCHFTGQREDAGIGLYFYGARYCDAALGRFISADTLVPNPGDPQSLNRYAYALNNPLKYRDPSGHWVETAWDIANIGWDIYEIKNDPSALNIGARVVDVAAAVIPVVPAGAGLIARSGKAAVEVINHADDVADAAKLLSRGEETFDAVRTVQGFAETDVREATQIAGLLPASTLHYHHIFPQQWKDWFHAPGRSIDIDKFTVQLNETTHLRGVHGKGGFVAIDDIAIPGRWNVRWEEFISKNPNATAKDIYQFAGTLMDEFGLSGLEIMPYPN